MRQLVLRVNYEGPCGVFARILSPSRWSCWARAPCFSGRRLDRELGASRVSFSRQHQGQMVSITVMYETTHSRFTAIHGLSVSRPCPLGSIRFRFRTVGIRPAARHRAGRSKRRPGRSQHRSWQPQAAPRPVLAVSRLRPGGLKTGPGGLKTALASEAAWRLKTANGSLKTANGSLKTANGSLKTANGSLSAFRPANGYRAASEKPAPVDSRAFVSYPPGMSLPLLSSRYPRRKRAIR